MQTEVIVAIIGVFGTITAALIAATAAFRKKKNDESSPTVAQPTINVEGDKNVVGDNNHISVHMSSKQEAKIHIVDTEFVTDKGDFFIDIKLRNSGDKVAFLKKIVFNVMDVYSMRNPNITHYSLITPTATYDAVLDEKKEQTFSLSQAIAPDSVDRFRIKVASSIATTRMVAVYYFSYTLLYNEDDRTSESPKFIATFPSTSEWVGCFVSGTSMHIAKENYLQLQRMAKYDCVKSDHFLNVLKSYEKSKSNFIDIT